MTGSPDWLADAECKRRGIPPKDFVPNDGGEPTARARAACKACPVKAPCAADRNGDFGLRGDGFIGGQHGLRVRMCVDCGQPWKTRGGGYQRCPTCAKRRKEGAA